MASSGCAMPVRAPTRPLSLPLGESVTMNAPSPLSAVAHQEGWFS